MSVKTNFGITPDHDAGKICPSEVKDKGPSYPKVCFRDEHMEKLQEVVGAMPDIDDEIVVTTTFRVCGLQKGEYGRSIDLEVVDMDGAVTKEGDESEEEEKPKPASKSKKSAPVAAAY